MTANGGGFNRTLFDLIRCQGCSGRKIQAGLCPRGTPSRRHCTHYSLLNQLLDVWVCCNARNFMGIHEKGVEIHRGTAFNADPSILVCWL